MWYAMLMRVTPGLSWIAVYWKATPIPVLEGMAIAGYAIGAAEGLIYCRAEYPLAIKRLTIAIQAAREAGLLGEGILGRPFSFDIRIKEGAGLLCAARKPP